MRTDEPTEMMTEYGDLLHNGVRGKYFDRVAETRIVLLDPDVATVFSDSKQVNDILRAMIAATKPGKLDETSP